MVKTLELEVFSEPTAVEARPTPCGNAGMLHAFQFQQAHKRREEKMFVEKHMTRAAVTIEPHESLAAARAKMEAGLFGRLPVVEHEKLVGIITDRDVRIHWNALESTKVQAAMTAHVMTVTPKTRIEHAAEMMVMRKIGGLPVVENDKLVGIITLTDVIAAFLDLIGSEPTLSGTSHQS